MKLSSPRRKRRGPLDVMQRREVVESPDAVSPSTGGVKGARVPAPEGPTFTVDEVLEMMAAESAPVPSSDDGRAEFDAKISAMSVGEIKLAVKDGELSAGDVVASEKRGLKRPGVLVLAVFVEDTRSVRID